MTNSPISVPTNIVNNQQNIINNNGNNEATGILTVPSQIIQPLRSITSTPQIQNQVNQTQTSSQIVTALTP